MRKVIHIVRMWPTAEDPQHGGFIVSHVRALADHAEQRILIWDGKWNATPLYAEEFSLAQPTTPGFRAKWRTLREWLDAELPHVVHVHGAGNDSALAFLLLHMLHGSRIRRVVTEHQSHWAEKPSRGADLDLASCPCPNGRFRLVGLPDGTLQCRSSHLCGSQRPCAA